MKALYPTPANAVEVISEVKKSRFIAYATSVVDRESAMAQLELVRAKYPDARHHCWAYVLGNPVSPRSAAMNDDGEPSGTAGRPILKVLQHKAIGDVMIIVSRYFGGVKLGAGGLVRAYSSAAELSVRALKLTQHVPTTSCKVRCGFAHEQLIRHWLEQHQGHVTGADYGEEVLLKVDVPVADFEPLVAFSESVDAIVQQ
ncbi:MAG: YigZ family protein [Idiomarina sp.]|nr:YigZ family protein [Idiomarina sp.]